MDFPQFVENHRYFLSQQDENDPSITADVQRKCLTQVFNCSNNFLDNQSGCYLLEKNLREYSKTIDENACSIFDNQIRNIVKEKPLLKSNLSKIDIKQIIKPLSCSELNDFNCTKSEKVGDVEFNEFLNGFKHSIKPHDKHLKPSKISLPPQIDRNFSKVNNSESSVRPNYFKTAGEILQIQNAKIGNNNQPPPPQQVVNGGQKRKLGIRRNVNSKFVSPLLSYNSEESLSKSDEGLQEVDERLKNIDQKMIELIKSEIMDCGPTIEWGDIAGLEFAKTAIQEAVVWPMLRPDIFTGLRRPPKGILLFGPPGTGKTLIGKCVASQSKSTFFSISASSLTSKWVGDGEKMVRALFAVARCYQPAVIFIDEIDSLLSQRSDQEHESSRRIKTEFLVQLDGAATDNEERLLVIGATNRPQELDEAARRRFVKRLYIPLPEFEARLQLVIGLISKEKHSLSRDDFVEIATMSAGYSGADIKNLCSEAALGPIRSIDMRMIEVIHANEVRALIMDDFKKAFTRIKSSVSPQDLNQYTMWDKTYGSGL